MKAETRHWIRSCAALTFCGVLYLGFASAQSGDEKNAPPAQPKLFELPKVFTQPAPANVDDLRAIEKHVQKVVDKVMPAIVGVRVVSTLENGKKSVGQGSGVIVKEDGTILTAGHVSGTPKKKADVILPNGNILAGKTYGQNKGVDSGMLKITGEAKYPFVEMGKSSELKRGDWVVAIGHPGGFRPNRTAVVRVGRVLFVSPSVIRTDCTLVGGDSGGPLFDMQGRVVGIHSRIGGAAITENVHVPIDYFTKEWDRLAKAESFGQSLGLAPTVMSLGGKIVFDKKDRLTKDDPTEPCPNDNAEKSYRKVYTVPLKAGQTYTIDLVGADRKGIKLDVFLRLESPAGERLAEDDDGGGFPDARIVYRALKDGNYRVIATSVEPKQTGAFQLTVRAADFLAGQVEVLRSVKISPFAIPKLLQEFAKVDMHLHVQALLVDDKGAPLPGKEVTLKWNQGKETVKSDPDGLIRWPLKKDKSKSLSMELPQGTRAALVVTDQDGNFIPFDSGKDDPSVEIVKSAGGPIVKTFEGALIKTDPFDLEREKCYRRNHDFKMQAGKTYTLDLLSEDFDAYLRVEHEEQGKLAEDDDSGGFNNARIVFTPPRDGTYRLVVTTCDPGQHGAYRLTIRETNVKTAELKKDKK